MDKEKKQFVSDITIEFWYEYIMYENLDRIRMDTTKQRFSRNI